MYPSKIQFSANAVALLLFMFLSFKNQLFHGQLVELHFVGNYKYNKIAIWRASAKIWMFEPLRTMQVEKKRDYFGEGFVRNF